MAEVAEADLAPAAIEATLNYILISGETPYTYSGGPGSTELRSEGKQDPRRVTIRNGRVSAETFSLERNGFRLAQHDTQVVDFFDEAQVRRVYYPEIDALVRAEIG